MRTGLGTFIVRRLLHCGYASQRNLISRLGISNTTFQRLLDGVGKPHENTTERVAAALRFPTWDALLDAYRDDDMLRGLEDDRLAAKVRSDVTPPARPDKDFGAPDRDPDRAANPWAMVILDAQRRGWSAEEISAIIKTRPILGAR